MPTDHSIPLSLHWHRLALESIKLLQVPLPIAARTLSMLHTAMFNAWSVFDQAISTNTSSFIKISGSRSLANSNKQKAFSYAAYRVLTELFRAGLPAEKKNIFRDMMFGLNFNPDDGCLDVAQASGVGNLAARLVIESFAGDGSNSSGTLHSPAWSDFTGYEVEKENKNENFLLPHWGLVQSFSLENNAQFRPPPPYRKSQTQFQEQAKEMIQVSAKLTDEQKVIAEYWNDDSLIVHWCEIAQFAANSNGYANNDCIKLFFAFANSIFDATIACWDCLRYYDAASPADVIHEQYMKKEIEGWAGPNRDAQKIRGEEWRPYSEMQHTPGYVSPQSSISHAAALILQRYTGSDQFRGFTTIERGDSKIEKGLTPAKDIQLDWPTYTEAARQAGIAGLYGGNFFSQAIHEGQQLGKSVGQRVWEKSIFYFND